MRFQLIYYFVTRALDLREVGQWCLVYIHQKYMRVKGSVVTCPRNDHWLLLEPEPLFTKRTAVLSQDLVKFRSRVIMLEWSYRSEIWQASRQCCCPGANYFLGRLEKTKPESGGFETLRDLAVNSRDLAVRRSSAYWIEALTQHSRLTHYHPDQMNGRHFTDEIFKLVYMEMVVFLLKCHWNLFSNIRLAINPHWLWCHSMRLTIVVCYIKEARETESPKNPHFSSCLNGVYSYRNTFRSTFTASTE